jgi:purine-nucleoside phosphorylase
MLEAIDRAVQTIRAAGVEDPLVGIVLGTGLGKLADEISVIRTLEYADIPHFPLSTVESHSGTLIYGTLRGKKVLAMKGRFHYYEGYSLQQVTFPVRVMKMLGVKTLLLSNAAGALNRKFKKGSLMLLDDHINFLPDNPLRGRNEDSLGPRFPDMSRPYSPELNRRLKEIAAQRHILLHEGTYVAVPGPNLETRAEYRMFGNYADAVGMSTVPEVIVANHMGLPCAAISVLTDECDPDHLVPASLEEILRVAAGAEKHLITLFSDLIAGIHE